MRHAHAQALKYVTQTLCHARYRVKANKLSGYFAMNSDASVVLWELSLVLYTFCLGKNPLLFLLSVESSSGGEEGGSCKQMENKVFSVKSTQSIHFEHHNEPYNSTRYVARAETDTHTKDKHFAGSILRKSIQPWQI